MDTLRHFEQYFSNFGRANVTGGGNPIEYPWKPH